MSFKLGKQSRYDGSGKANTPNKPLKFVGLRGLSTEATGSKLNTNPHMDDNTLATANNDGSIDVNPSLDVNSPLGKRVIRHEQQHVDDMKSGRANYDDHYVTWEGEKHQRINVNGKWGVMWNGEFKEDGDRSLPWEQSAINAE
jgi:hypothetical protein